MHRKNSLHRVRMRKNKRVLRGISLGAKFMVVLVGLVTIFKKQLVSLVNNILSKITSQSNKI